MNEKEFIFWLKGFTDSMGSRPPTQADWDKIRHELALIFNKVTPYRPNTQAIAASAAPLKPIQPWPTTFVASGMGGITGQGQALPNLICGDSSIYPANWENRLITC